MDEGWGQILGGYRMLAFLPKDIVAGVPYTYAQLAAVALIISISAINYVGVRPGSSGARVSVCRQLPRPQSLTLW